MRTTSAIPKRSWTTSMGTTLLRLAFATPSPTRSTASRTSPGPFSIRYLMTVIQLMVTLTERTKLCTLVTGPVGNLPVAPLCRCTVLPMRPSRDAAGSIGSVLVWRAEFPQ